MNIPMEDQPHISRVIDVLRFPLCALVVLYHAFFCAVTVPPGALNWHQPYTDFFYWALLHDSLARAAVPLFFSISGFLYFNGLEHFTGQVWWKKTKARLLRLIVPLITWEMLALVFYGILYVCGAQNTTAKWLFGNSHSPWWWIDSFFGFTIVTGPRLCTAGWFVRDLFFAGLLSPFWYALLNRKWGTSLALGMLFGFDLVGLSAFPFLRMSAMFYFCLGAAYAIHCRDFALDAERIMWPCVVLWLVGFIVLRFWNIPILPRFIPVLMIPVLVGMVSRGIRKRAFYPVPWLAASAFFVYFCHVSLWFRVPLHFFLIRMFAPYSDWACLSFIMLNWVLEASCSVSLFLLLRRFMPITLVLLAGIRQTKPRSRSRD